MLRATVLTLSLATSVQGETVRGHLVGVGEDYFDHARAENSQSFRYMMLLPESGEPPIYLAQNPMAAVPHPAELYDLELAPTTPKASQLPPHLADARAMAAGGSVNRTAVTFQRVVSSRKVGGDEMTFPGRRRAVDDGQRSMLIVRIETSDTTPTYCDADCAYDQMWGPDSSAKGQGTAVHFDKSSFGRLTFPEELGAVVTVRMNEETASGCDWRGLGDRAVSGWDDHAVTAHFRGSSRPSNFDPSDFDNIAFFLPSNIAGGLQCGFGGIAWVQGCNDPFSNTYCRSWVRSTWASTLAHEIGHNLGLGHAATDTDDDHTGACEYCDVSDVMGNANYMAMHNAPHLEAMTWLGVGNGITFIDNFWECSTDQMQYEIQSLVTDPATLAPEQQVALKFYRVPSATERSRTVNYCNSRTCPCDSDWRTTLFYDDSNNVQRVEYMYYYISYRSSSGIDANLATSMQDRVFVHYYAPNSEKNWIDLSHKVVELQAGETWSEPRSGVAVTVTTTSSSSATVQMQFSCEEGVVRPTCGDCGQTCVTTASTTTTHAPVDCEVSDWSSEGDCDAVCDGASTTANGVETFTRTVVTPAAYGGEACPSLREQRPCETNGCSTTAPCVSDPGFVDVDGFSCARYESEEWCSPANPGGFGPRWRESWGDIDDWGEVRLHCCVCRGPDYVAPVSTPSTSSTTTAAPTCPSSDWKIATGEMCSTKKSHECCSGMCAYGIKRCLPVGYCPDVGQKKFKLEGAKCKKDNQCCSGVCNKKRCTAPQSSSNGFDFALDPEMQKEFAAVERYWDTYEETDEETEGSDGVPASGIAAGVVAAAAVVAVVAGMAWRSRRAAPAPRKESVYEEMDAGLAPALHSIRRANPLFGESADYGVDTVVV